MSKIVFILTAIFTLSACVPDRTIVEGVTGNDLEHAYKTCTGYDDKLPNVTRQKAFEIRLACTAAVYGGQNE